MLRQIHRKKGKIMSSLDRSDYENVSVPNPSTTHPEEYGFFAFIVDGKVAITFNPHKERMSLEYETFLENPKVIRINNEQKFLVKSGWKYNSEADTFSE